MLSYILKKIGRLFLILTHEDSDFNPDSIKEILMVALPGEEHLYKAIGALYKRFKYARFNILLPDSKIALASRYPIFKKAVKIGSSSIFPYLKGLKEFNGHNVDMVAVLSLNPFLIYSVFNRFDCPKLLYNYYDETYLVRYRTILEFLSCKSGADRMASRKNIFIFFINTIAPIFRLIAVCFYIASGLLILSFKKRFYAR